MALVISPNCIGIYPGDIVIRTAIMAAFDELRDQPWLLDFAFQSLLNDELTVQQYGAAALEEQKNWFLGSKITVTLGYKINNVSVPHVVIWLANHQEAEATHGDVAEVSRELIPWVTATTALMTFTAARYDQVTGIITLPAHLSTAAIFPGMRVLDRNRGRAHEILEIIDDHSFTIEAGTQVVLSGAQIVNASSLWSVSLEGIANSETYSIDVVVPGDSIKCIVLHALLRWSLNRCKQRLLEARGFERSSISSSGVLVAQDGENAAQILFKRSLTLTGITREMWPKDVRAPLQGVVSGLEVESAAAEGDIDDMEANQGWSTVDE